MKIKTKILNTKEAEAFKKETYRQMSLPFGGFKVVPCMIPAIKTKLLSYTPIDKDVFVVNFGKYKIGEISVMESGHYVFWFEGDHKGFWEAWILIELGEKLREMNKDWDAQIEKDIGPKPTSPAD